MFRPDPNNPLDRLMTASRNFSAAPNLLSGLLEAGHGLTTGQALDPRRQAQQIMQMQYADMMGQPGMTPGRAIANLQNPDLMKEYYGTPKTPEEVVARSMWQQLGHGGSAGGGGAAPGRGDAMNMLADYLRTKSSATAGGTLAGTSQQQGEIDLGTAVTNAQEQLRLIQEMRTHPGREGNPFFHNKLANDLPDTAIPGNTAAYGANSLLNQLRGQNFMQAYQTLKGGGQITEIEGKKATEALARIQRPQSKAEFDRGLSDLEGMIRNGLDIAARRAGHPAPFGFRGNQPFQQVSPGVSIRQVQ